MSYSNVVSSANYLAGTRSLISAGRYLRKSLEKDHATVEYAITRLEHAADENESSGISYQAFMFSAMEKVPAVDRVTRGQMTEDVLASVLTDVQSASVLLAAGEVLGEAGPKADPKSLDEALLRLDNTATLIERTLSSAAGAMETRFSFTGEQTQPLEIKSVDLESAIASFRQCSGDVLTSLVDEAREVVMGVVEALSKLDPDKVMEALGSLGGKMAQLPEVGKLVYRGIAKLQTAINSLIRLLGDDLLMQVREKAEKIWNDLKSGKYVAGPLEWAFGVEETRARIEEILLSGDLKQASLDDAANAMTNLRVAYKNNMALLKSLSVGLSAAAALLFLIPGLGSTASLAAATSYSVIFGAVLLIGMDYADHGELLNRVRGVRAIAESVL